MDLPFALSPFVFLLFPGFFLADFPFFASCCRQCSFSRLCFSRLFVSLRFRLLSMRRITVVEIAPFLLPRAVEVSLLFLFCARISFVVDFFPFLVSLARVRFPCRLCLPMCLFVLFLLCFSPQVLPPLLLVHGGFFGFPAPSDRHWRLSFGFYPSVLRVLPSAVCFSVCVVGFFVVVLFLVFVSHRSVHSLFLSFLFSLSGVLLLLYFLVFPSSRVGSCCSVVSCCC